MTGDESAVVTLLLLRHGQVANHKGDVPLTELGVAQSQAAGRWFAEQSMEIACLLTGETNRAKDTGSAFVDAYRSAGGVVDDPTVSFALRNPDLYLGGHRINMAEGAEALAAQSPPVAPADVEGNTFFREFMTAPDRVGFWLEHANPPGDTARGVGQRIDHVARSLADVPAWRGRLVVAMTHSPVLRAVRFHHWGDFSKEPPFLHGYRVTLSADGQLRLAAFATSTGNIPATARPGETLRT